MSCFLALDNAHSYNGMASWPLATALTGAACLKFL